jgi:hypothetical protein
MFLGCEVAKFVLVRLKYDITVFTLVVNDDFGLWILFLKVGFAFDVCVIGTLIPEFHSTEVAVKCLCAVYMFLGCEVEFHFFPTSELDCTVVALMFYNGLWILFMKMSFGFDVLVVDALILTL